MSCFLGWVTPTFAVVRSDGRPDGEPQVKKFDVLRNGWLIGSTGDATTRLSLVRACRVTARILNPTFDVLAKSLQSSARLISRDDEERGVGLALIGKVDGRLRAITFPSGEKFQPCENRLPSLLTMGAVADDQQFIRASDPLLSRLQWASLAQAETIMDEMLEQAYTHGNGLVRGERFAHTL